MSLRLCLVAALCLTPKLPDCVAPCENLCVGGVQNPKDVLEFVIAEVADLDVGGSGFAGEPAGQVLLPMHELGVVLVELELAGWLADRVLLVIRWGGGGFGCFFRRGRWFRGRASWWRRGLGRRRRWR